MDMEVQHPRSLKHGLAFRLASLALVVVVGLSGTGFLMVHMLGAPEGETPPPNAPNAKTVLPLFHDWPQGKKPDLVLVLSGERHGFIQPCGCSKPQYGGLERLYNFVQNLIKGRGWPTVCLDLGDIPQRTGPQALLKYKYSMEAMKKIDFTATGIGKHEMGLPLLEALAHFALDNPSPRVLAANLQKKEENFVGAVASWEVTGTDKQPKVGVIGVVGPSVAQQVRDPSVKFDAVANTLPTKLKEMEAKKPEVLVLLYQGNLDEAKACAKAFPQFHVILCLSREEEPSEKPEKVGDTLIVGVGHKGRYVGCVGVYRTADARKPFELRYQLASLGPDLETAGDKVQGHPILDLYESYTKEVKHDNYLARYPRTKHPIQLEKGYEKSVYVGSEKCKNCHPNSYDVWSKSGHAHAYQTLVDAKRPALREFDGECIVCHTIGFNYESGYKRAVDKTGSTDTAYLRNVGCENCHGPASMHVLDSNDKVLYKLMNPHKTQPNEDEEQKKKRINALDRSCQLCHDIDNDVHWNIKKWDKIIHKEEKGDE